ncbi:MAG: AAA family ATPase [Bacteroidia bacterium]|nr:AAA family ATPase [Bacteroidia bacterium]
MDLFAALTDFLAAPKPVHFSDSVFVICGYAGTGKTSVVRTLVKTLPATSLKTVLLAPTGRAAKVMAAYSGHPAFTIHKRIYFTEEADNGLRFSLQANKYKNTLFIVDEASMIGSEAGNDLLGDLISYVQAGQQCRMILIGDDAQLPPVGRTESPALDQKVLEDMWNLQVHIARLTEVMRQEKGSGILVNATNIRTMLSGGELGIPRFNVSDDVVRLPGNELEDTLNSALSKYGDDEVLLITRSNRSANAYNQQIRTRIRWQENDISAGDRLMVVKNNYHWLPEQSGAGFIANGDTAEVCSLGKFYEYGNFRLADAEIRLSDYDQVPTLPVRLLLNTLHSEQAGMPAQEQKELYRLVEADYSGIGRKRERMKQIRNDPSLNALHVKFAYAVTCHKSQGGQWRCVFIDQGYITEEMMDLSYLRWIYTALTRASEQVYLVNFPSRFFPED